MTRKPLKIALVAAAALLLALTAGVVFASTKTQSAGLPEYVGSGACLGCHSEKYVAWETSLHSTYVEEIKSVADLPADPTGIAPELAEELAKADYYFHGRFLTKDLKTGELKYLPIEFNEAAGAYVAAPSRKGTSMDANCGGCHAGRDYQTGGATREVGVSCESCHGPGREHILGKGDVSKISVSADPTQNCAACHSGYNQKPGAARYPVGYRPAMDLADANFLGMAVDPNAAPLAMHHKGAVPQWEASRHATATDTLLDHGYQTRSECIYCHSTSAGLLIPELTASGQKWDASKHLVNDGVTCVACHDPHGSTVPFQLKKDAQEMCLDCHTIGRTNRVPQKIGIVRAPHSPQGDMVNGTGALGVADTKGAHTGVTCIECHMTGGNHQFKVLEPEHVAGTTQKDACSACHTNSSPESRGVYLEMWNESINNKLATISKDVEAIDARLAANPNALSKELTDSYKNWRANYWYVNKDKSGGAHNFEYAVKILTQTQKEIANIRTLLK